MRSTTSRVSAVRARVGRVGERCGEEAVGPLFGEAARVGEHQVDFGVAHQRGEAGDAAVMAVEDAAVVVTASDNAEAACGAFVEGLSAVDHARQALLVDQLSAEQCVEETSHFKWCGND